MDLLRLLAGWTRAPRADGADLFGPGGELSIRHGVHPIPTLRAVIDAAIGRGAPVARLERFPTLEGEHAAMASGEAAEASEAGGRAWAVAVAVGEDRAATVAGRGAPAIAELVRALAAHAYFGLGVARRRRYVYAPPPGWRGLVRPYAARWLHPGFPRTPHALTVHDARPIGVTAPELADRLLLASSTHGRALEPPGPQAPVRTAAGLAGTYTRIDYREDGELRSVVRCALADARFAYVVELGGPSASLAQDLPVLEAVVESIERLPAAGAPDLTGRLLYWGD